jgi:UMF1 family MFS transporter
MHDNRKRIWGWYFFDWASQPFHTLLLTFVFGPYFAAVASEALAAGGLSAQAADARAQAMWSGALAVIGLIIGLSAPVMGAIADTTGRRIPWIAGFSVLAVGGAVAIWGTQPDGSNLWWGLAAFGLAFIGAELAFIFTNSLLPGLTEPADRGRVSGTGFAFGYAGGLIALFIMLLFFVEQASGRTLIGLAPALGLDADAREGTRFVGPFVGLWYAVFMIPFFLWVRDTGPRIKSTFGTAMGNLGQLVASLRHRGSVTTYLFSSMFYRDALNGLYGFGGTYAALVLDWSITRIGIFGIISALTAMVFAWIGGRLDARFGPKPVIAAAIVILMAICLVIVGMTRESIYGWALPIGSSLPDTVFFVCGALIGGMGGMLQAASRTLMANHCTKGQETELFGLYGLAGRATAFLAPWLIGMVTLATGSARLGVAPLIGLFALGLVLLLWVDQDGDRPA